MRSLLRKIILSPLVLGAPLLLGCPSEPPQPTEFKPLRDDLPWAGTNRARIDELMKTRGSSSESYDAAHPPVATLDLDNTVLKNDIGDATLFYMLRKDKILQPPGRAWKRTSPLLTEDATKALSKACDTLAEPGLPLPTSADAACAGEILSIYSNSKTVAGADAFGAHDRRRMEPAYAWAAQLSAGYSAADSRALGEAALREGLAAAEGTKQKIGGVEVTGWLRVYDQMRDTIRALGENGFSVWIVSASPQPWVEAVAAEVGLPAERVIGIRQIVRDGKLSADLAGCGDVPDGQSDPGMERGNSMIPYIDGKRCWINQTIFGVKGADALTRQTDPLRRQVFAAGDSNTDISFLQDAVGLRLVLNRNKAELMCNAYNNAGGTWLVNQMFIQPLPRRAEAYPCSTTACVDRDGKKGPCLDEAGKPIADQQDSVFAP